MIVEQTKLKVDLDETAINTGVFKTLSYIQMNKQEFFKYAILCWEVPAHIKESDYFDHLQSKIPSIAFHKNIDKLKIEIFPFEYYRAFH